MSFSLETNTTENEYAIPERYKAIEEANRKSFYMNNPNRSFDVFQSIQSVGEKRIDPSTLTEEELEAARVDPWNLSPEELAAAHIARRIVAGGNMSTVGPYGPLELESNEARIEDATNNMSRYFDSIGAPKESAFVLNPERDYTTPLTVVDVDAQEVGEGVDRPLRLDKSGDFIFTRNPNNVFTVRPADCPVMIASADTPEGKIYMMVHYAWKGAANGYVEQTAAIFDSLGVDRSSLEIYLSAGGQAESFPYNNYPQDPRKEYPNAERLFWKPESHVNEDGEEKWNFGIDTPKFVYDEVIKQFEIDPEQVFCDTSDTSSLSSGHSSHGRSARFQQLGLRESNNRDIVVAVFNNNALAA